MRTPEENKSGIPEGWDPIPPQTDAYEGDILTNAFGAPDENGIYAPHIEDGDD